MAKEHDDIMVTRSLSNLKILQLQNLIKEERRLIEESEKLGLMMQTVIFKLNLISTNNNSKIVLFLF